MKDYSHINDPVMIYIGAYYAIVEANQAPTFLAAGWSPIPLTDINTEPKPYEGDMSAASLLQTTESKRQVSLDAMTKPELLAHAKDGHGMDLSDKLTKAQIIEAIQQKGDTNGSAA